MKTWKTLFAAALFTAFAAQAQAGAIDALKKFNDDADGISGSFTQRKRKPARAVSKSCGRGCSAGNTPRLISKRLWAMAKPFGCMTLN